MEANILSQYSSHVPSRVNAIKERVASSLHIRYMCSQETYYYDTLIDQFRTNILQLWEYQERDPLSTSYYCEC